MYNVIYEGILQYDLCLFFYLLCLTSISSIKYLHDLMFNVSFYIIFLQHQ